MHSGHCCEYSVTNEYPDLMVVMTTTGFDHQYIEIPGVVKIIEYLDTMHSWNTYLPSKVDNMQCRSYLGNSYTLPATFLVVSFPRV